MLQVHVIPCLKDNYAYLIGDSDSHEAWVVDPSEAAPIEAALRKLGLQLTLILNTHHHWDHVGGNLELKSHWKVPIVCSAYDQPRIDGADRGVHAGDDLKFGSQRVQIIEIPGHTLGHIAFYFERQSFVFTGDTLFSAGCGRLFEGTPEQMYTSLQTLARLPDETQVFCGHEYTEANLKFARVVEPENSEMRDYASVVRAKRLQGQPSIPSTIAIEKDVNVFVRAKTADQFKVLRQRKDDF